MEKRVPKNQISLLLVILIILAIVVIILNFLYPLSEKKDEPHLELVGWEKNQIIQ